MGKWKAIRKDIKKGNMKIELYDLSVDIKEKNDIADKHPDIISTIEEIMEREHSPSEIEKFKFKELGDI